MEIKDELYIKPIDKESYESVSSYLNELISISGFLNDPTIVMFNGKKFIIQKFIEGEGTGYAIVEDTDSGLKTYGFALDNENNERLIITDDYEIHIDLTPGEPAIEKLDSNRLRKESLFHKVYDSVSSLIYVNYDIQTNIGFDMKYRTSDNHNNLNYFINWLQYKNPDIIEFTRIKRGRVKDISTYLKVLDDKYARSNFRIPTLGYYTVGKNVIDKDTMKSIVNNYGFEMEVPSDLTSILTQTNEEVKTLKLVANAYKHSKTLKP